MKIRQVDFESPVGISCSIGVVDDSSTSDLPSILVVSFAGTYPEGSRGNNHGHYIAASTVHGLAIFDPWCVVLDFRDLDYRWGNTLLLVFEYIERFMGGDEGDPSFPVVVVTSDKCREAFLSLVTPTGGQPPEWHFDDVDAALSYAVLRANEWIDA